MRWSTRRINSLSTNPTTRSPLQETPHPGEVREQRPQVRLGESQQARLPLQSRLEAHRVPRQFRPLPQGLEVIGRGAGDEGRAMAGSAITFATRSPRMDRPCSLSDVSWCSDQSICVVCRLTE